MSDDRLKRLEQENKKLQEELKKTKDLLGLYKKKCRNSEESYNQLLYIFKNFQRHRFGSKCERFTETNHQRDLFQKEATTIS